MCYKAIYRGHITPLITNGSGLTLQEYCILNKGADLGKRSFVNGYWGESNPKHTTQLSLGGRFQICVIFYPTWGDDPI